ncbi:MAG TPA: MerR family transcriptional regulator [Thermomicrobiales bacterium]|nr:MerR family transcriptional regulator [Thermomicrobiales bacterium]
MKRETLSYAVGQLAELAGVTVRTLHHFDRIGLLKPSGRTHAGYRLYGESDLQRLQQILLYRELGFPLEEIGTILDEPDGDAVVHLRRQRGLLETRIRRLELMVAAVDKEMEAYKMGIQLTPEERFEVWGDFDPDEHAAEAEERWGDSDAFGETQRRASRYSKEDWLRIKAEADDVTERLVAAMTSGEPPDGNVAMDLVEVHRQHISRWFYECSHEMQAALGDMYVADPRFRKTYEDMAQGLAEYVRAAIRANAAQAESA